MSVPLSLLQGVGKSALPILTGGLLSVVEIGSTIASQVWEWWGKQKKDNERRAELEALAQATAAELRTAVREVVAEIAQGKSPAEQSRLESYLLAVPAQVRRTLRRPSDVLGRTIPVNLSLSQEIDLVPLLPPRPPRFAIGDRVADFELVELLGIGGFGEVWKARNAFMPGAPAVALKFCIDTDAAASLRQETTLLDRIQWEGTHPGIVPLRHTFLSAEPPFLEYELVEGGDLGGLIVEWHRQKGGPTPVEAARLIQRLAEIMAFAHARGIIHRDLKPANILVQGEVGSLPRLKIADFGIGAITADTASRVARMTGGLASTRTAAAVSGGYSLYYASPEQMRGAKADPRDDVHALGVIWYQLLVGDLTVEAPRGPGWKKRLAAKGMSAELIEYLEGCLASEREDRPANATEVAEQLGLLADGRSTATKSSTSTHRPGASNTPVSSDSVLPPEALDQVVGSVSEKMTQVEKKNRQNKFVTTLRTLLETLLRILPPNTVWTFRNILIVVFLIMCSGGCGVGGAFLIWAISDANEEYRLGQAYSTNQFTLTPQFASSYYGPPMSISFDDKKFVVRVMGRRGRTMWVKIDTHTPSAQDLTADGNSTYGFPILSSSASLSSSSPEYSTVYRVSPTLRRDWKSDPYATEASAKAEAQELATSLNTALKKMAAESDHPPFYTTTGSLIVLGIVTGVLSLLLLRRLRVEFHRRKVKRLTRSVDEIITQLETEFPVDMAKYSKRVNLHDPEAVRELVEQVERRTATQ